MFRVISRSNILRTSVLRSTVFAPITSEAIVSRGIASYNLRNIQNTWDKLKPEEKEQVIDYITGSQEEDWKKLSKDEKKASYFVSFGKWGPRAGEEHLKKQKADASRLWKVFLGSVILISFGLLSYNYSIDEEKMNDFIEYEKINPEN